MIGSMMFELWGEIPVTIVLCIEMCL